MRAESGIPGDRKISLKPIDQVTAITFGVALSAREHFNTKVGWAEFSLAYIFRLKLRRPATAGGGVFATFSDSQIIQLQSLGSWPTVICEMRSMAGKQLSDPLLPGQTGRRWTTGTRPNCVAGKRPAISRSASTISGFILNRSILSRQSPCAGLSRSTKLASCRSCLSKGRGRIHQH